MKQKLKIEELGVESFVVSEEREARGTVHGNQIRSMIAPDACAPTFVFSCGYPQTTCPK